MKIIDAVTGKTEILNAVVKDPIKQLAVKFTGTDLDPTDWILRVEKHGGNSGTEDPSIEDISLHAIAEMNAISIDPAHIRVVITEAKITSYEAMIDLNNHGIVLGLNEELRISLKGLTSGDTHTVYGIEDTQKSASIFVYEKREIRNVTKDTFQVGQVDIMSIPKNTFSEIELLYMNGTNVKYNADELTYMMCQTNCLTAFDKTAKTVYKAENWLYYTLDVSSVLTVKLTVTGDTDVITLTLQ